MRCVFMVPFLVIACSKTPEEAATLYAVQVSNGLAFAGGAAIAKQHVLTDLHAFENQKTGQVFTAQGEKYGVAVLSRDSDVSVAILLTEDDIIPHSSIGDSTELGASDMLATQVFDENGQAKLLTGEFRGWQFGEGVAWLRTNVDAPEEAVGAGYFGPDGKLIGIQAMKRGKTTLLLPIEYVTNGPQAITSGLLGEKEDSLDFADKRKQGLAATDEIPEPPSYKNIVYEYSFSRSALLASLLVLDKKDNPSHVAQVKYTIEGTDAANKKTTIAEGGIAKRNLQWIAMDSELETLKEEAGRIFGIDFVREELDPFSYGEMHVRLPHTEFCSRVKPDQVYTFWITLLDGRKVGENYNDMANLCTLQEEGPGDAWEREWGMESAPVTPSPAKKRMARKGKRAKRAKRKRLRRRRRR